MKIIAVLGREMAPDAGAAGIHDRRERTLDRLGLVEAALDMEVAAIMVELLLGRPQSTHHLQPFGCIGVTFVMLHDGGTEHFELGLEPAADDVQCEASAGDVVDGGRLLGSDDRMDGRHVRR
jgi:hypothetical protein